ncbi:hypothetical protein QT989_25665 [Microcoleus sp. SVA1_B6]|uniref:hypothetical protein n=1 Tax=Microcoleus sp. SVA1_B6 TaxID=2818952 RepID=UPI002FD47288
MSASLNSSTESLSNLDRFAVRVRVNLPVIEMKKKIAVSNPSRASYREFGINDRVGRYCRFEEGVWVHNDGEGDTYFSCEIPLCRNGDRLEFQGFYTTTYGDNYSRIEEMKLSSGPYMVFEFMWEDEDGNIQTGYADNFESATW